MHTPGRCMLVPDGRVIGSKMFYVHDDDDNRPKHVIHVNVWCVFPWIVSTE
jgi:hypothetical protein